MKKKICKKCNLEIKKHEKGVTWITFEGNKELEVIHWHYKCFLEWRDENLQERAKKLYTSTVKAMMPQLTQMVKKKVGVITNEL